MRDGRRRITFKCSGLLLRSAINVERRLVSSLLTVCLSSLTSQALPYVPRTQLMSLLLESEPDSQLLARFPLMWPFTRSTGPVSISTDDRGV